MTVQDDAPASRRRPDVTQPRVEVVVVLRPAVDMAASAAGSAVAALVVGVRFKPGRGELVTDVLVATGMFAETVDDQDRRPRRTGPGTAGLGLVGRPVADQDVRAIGGVDMTDDG